MNVAMIKTLDFRADLAQLSDAEIAERLDVAWRAYDAGKKQSWWWRPLWSGMRTGWRGPLRHPRAYRFIAAFRSSGGTLLDALFAATLSGSRSEMALSKIDPIAGEHIHLCEIQDILDEIQRRVTKRQTGAS